MDDWLLRMKHSEWDGMDVWIGRDSSGALRINVETSGVDDLRDSWLNGVPKIRVQVNGGPIEQMNEDGDWEVGDGYPQVSPLEHLADAAE